jgi:hypothetical protein
MIQGDKVIYVDSNLQEHEATVEKVYRSGPEGDVINLSYDGNQVGEVFSINYPGTKDFLGNFWKPVPPAPDPEPPAEG